VTSIASIAIRAAIPPAPSSVEATAGHSKVETAAALNASTEVGQAGTSRHPC
jgi:hypothetical protein